ncbi:uncharacterized protein CEXT_287881 [Caerostris extrusa]|uniref:Uncharacterized protein n=1 Tax=Caerostris extrusa TaxID=172846 RepID=A0AAV4N499_CAEEX|nr:uncharacterized protein CEXT_287881 [Caerostris extrusa]
MNALLIFAVAFVVLGSCFAEEHDKEKRKEKVVSFYKCLACNDEAIAAYGKCEGHKPEKVEQSPPGSMCEKLVPEEFLEVNKRWPYFCKNPDMIERFLFRNRLNTKEHILTFDCLMDDEYFKSLTEEDLAALKKFKECKRCPRAVLQEGIEA